jgi:hypothetical protein
MMKIHSQNLNEKVGGRKGNILWHGRAWLYNDKQSSHVMSAEWVLFTHFCHFKIGILDEEPLSLSFACFLFAVWLNFDIHAWHAPLRKFFRVEGYEDRELSFSWHDNGLYWNLWTPSMEWSKVKHGRRQGAFHPVDFIFGKTKYSEIPISECNVEVPMPEGVYPAKIRLLEAQWKRPRWPFTWLRSRRAEVTPLKPIPFPGKGENSWDCGEDATHSMICSADTVEEAIGKMVASVMRDRMRYGGSKWRPQTV